MMKLSEKGANPPVLETTMTEGLVFLFNDERQDLATLTIDFGRHTTHCYSESLKVQPKPDGTATIVSIKPIAPHDFATLCFHDVGSYPVRVSGLGKEYSATIVVTE